MEKSGIFILKNSDTICLFFQGSITAPYGPSLLERIKTECNNCNISRIFLDLEKCSYVDSTIIGTLIQLKRIAKNYHSKFYLCNISERVKQIIETMDLFKFFDITETSFCRDILKKGSEAILSAPDNLNAEFLLMAHQNIVDVNPAMKKEFAILFETLKKELEK